MAYAGKDFSGVDVGESEVYSFDFASTLDTGETLTSTMWMCRDALTQDALASSRLIGSPSITGTICSHRIAGLLANLTYIVICTVQTSAGNTKILWSRVRTQEAGG